MELFRLLGTIALDNQKALEGIDQTESKASKLGDKFKSVGSKVSSFGVTMTKTVTAGATAAGTAIALFANKTAAATDRIDKMSQKIGISRQAYQELDFICSQSGTSVDTLQMGLKQLTNQMQSAAGGGKAATAAFEQLGISIYDSSGQLKSQEKMMWEAMSALQGMENQTEKAALATDLFGRSGSELMPLLNGASGSIEEMKKQAHELGLVISDEAVDSGVKFTDTLDQMKRAFSAAAVSCGSTLLPLLTRLAKWVTDKGVPYFKKFIDKVTGLVDWFSGLSDGTQKLILVLAALVVGIGPVLTIVGKMISTVGTLITIGQTLATFLIGLNPVFLGIVAGIAAVVAIGVTLYKNWDTIKEKASELFEKVSTTFENIKSKVKNVVDSIKGFFNFKLELPKIKLPHFSIKPSGWNIGDLLKGKIPKLGIDWYAKGGVFDEPTIFPTSQGLKGVGEAGKEAVAPISVLQSYVSDAVREENYGLIDRLETLISLLRLYLPTLADRNVVLDTGLLVGGLMPEIDAGMGKIYAGKERGR